MQNYFITSNKKKLLRTFLPTTSHPLLPHSALDNLDKNIARFLQHNTIRRDVLHFASQIVIRSSHLTQPHGNLLRLHPHYYTTICYFY